MPRALLVLAGVAAYVGWHVASLTRAPVPYFDDTFFASIGLSYLRSGELRLAVAPLWMRDPVLLYGPIYFLAQRFVFAHWGFGIFQNRVLALAGGLATIGLAVAVLRAAGARRAVALAAGMLLALDPTLNVSLHGGRMDAVAVALVLGSLLLLLRSRSGSRFMPSDATAGEPALAAGLGAGVLAALAVLTTPRSAFLVGALAATLAASWVAQPTRGRMRTCLAFALHGLEDFQRDVGIGAAFHIHFNSAAEFARAAGDGAG